MALIKCNHCGGVVSDKATVCPHCGNDPRLAKVPDATESVDGSTDNGKLTVCPHCGGTISKKAVACPHCGASVSADATMSVDATMSTDIVASVASSEKLPEETVSGDSEDAIPEDSSSRSLKIAVAIVGLGIVVFLLVLVFFTGAFAKKNPEVSYADSDTMVVADTTSVETAYTDTVAADTVSMEDALSNDVSDEADINRISDEEIGFRSDDDVRGFLAGRTYHSDDNELKITRQGIYVNGSDISKTYPEFTRVSGNVGRVTAHPSISITVRRDENMLVDNNSGERYYLSE